MTRLVFSVPVTRDSIDFSALASLIVLEQAPIYDENLAKIGPASPGEIMMMMIGRNYIYILIGPKS